MDGFDLQVIAFPNPPASPLEDFLLDRFAFAAGTAPPPTPVTFSVTWAPTNPIDLDWQATNPVSSGWNPTNSIAVKWRI